MRRCVASSEKLTNVFEVVEASEKDLEVIETGLENNDNVADVIETSWSFEATVKDLEVVEATEMQITVV